MFVGDLVDATGVDCDGLRVVRHHEGFTFRVPGFTRGRLSAEEVRELARRHPDYVTNWRYWARRVGGEGTPRRAFLRWVERADERPVPERYAALRDGTAREWGQLRIEIGLVERGSGDCDGDSGGERVYALRHVDDADAEIGDLEAVDPPDLRDIVKEDERGRYRPLKTAPTLPAGWAVTGLAGGDLVRAVDFVYPATVANWHREREGELDVTHYRETAERQTGIYDIVDELSVDQVEWLSEACCVDSQCLKRRQWDEDADTPLDVPRGDGEFPCREPCSLYVAAARKIATLEGEDPRAYTFELTPTEKEQVEAIVEAVADGQTDEIREADLNEGANRYRARYLRAKRMQEGDLSGTGTF
jgi:sirohydrochlorin ferrochelatase